MTEAPVKTVDLTAALSDCARRADACRKCEISNHRDKNVFADGNPKARIMIIGEGPGEQEDEQGVPYVGPAGLLLNKMLGSIGLDRKNDVYICNVIKCRAANIANGRKQNRPPTQTEASNCSEYLLEQIRLVQPKIIIAYGNPAMKELAKNYNLGITKNRGKMFYGPYDIPVMPSFHQAYLLRLTGSDAERDKRLAWEDLKVVRRFLSGDKSMLPPPPIAVTKVPIVEKDTDADVLHLF